MFFYIVLPALYTSTYCPTGLSTPILCPAGTYGPAVGQTLLSQCLACPMGTASITVGASVLGQCVACIPGLYAPTAGLDICVGCGSGSFSNITGSSNNFIT